MTKGNPLTATLGKNRQRKHRIKAVAAILLVPPMLHFAEFGQHFGLVDIWKSVGDQQRRLRNVTFGIASLPVATNSSNTHHVPWSSASYNEEATVNRSIQQTTTINDWTTSTRFVSNKSFHQQGVTKTIASATTDNMKLTPNNNKRDAIHNNNNATASVRVLSTDYIFQNMSWDAAPIVLEEFKLIFFTIPKVACTVWKKLFRRMMKYRDWRVQNKVRMVPYSPMYNGLRYLYHYDAERATHFMTSPQYTRAVFVRDPKERFVSAYLDKVVREKGIHIKNVCCPDGSCIERAKSVAGFLQLAQTCMDEHWRPQAKRVDEKYWPYMNFVGRMENLERDARRLLERVGAWEKNGRKRWGPYRNESIFMSFGEVSHSTRASDRVAQYITTPELERQIEGYYAEDYTNPWLNFSKRSIFGSQGS